MRADAILAWVALMLGVFLLARRPEVAGDRAAAGAERLLAYRLSEGGPALRLPLEARDADVRVIAWLASPAPWALDPRASVLYALQADVEDDAGTTVYTQTWWTRARSTPAPDALGRRTRQARVVGEPWAMSDDRLTRLDLGDLVSGAGTLALRATDLPEGAQVLIAAFRARDRSQARRLRVLLGDQAAAREELVADFSPFGWDGLPEDWRRELASTYWERLSARGASAEALPLSLVEARFDRDPWERAAADGLPVPPGGALAYNLRGARLSLRWTDDHGEPTPAEGLLRVVHADGTASTSLLSGEAQTVGPVDSVQVVLSPDLPAPLVVQATLGEGQGSWGDPPAKGALVAPDLRALIYHRALPEAGLRYPVAPEESRLRVRLRPRLPPRLPGLLRALPAALAGPSVTLQALDAAGARVGAWALRVAPLPSLFERYAQGDDPGQAAVSEAETWFMVLPAGTRTVTVGSDQAVDVAMAVPVEEPAWPEDPRYALPEGLAAAARYEPDQDLGWWPRAPTGGLPEQEIRIDAQVRLELARATGEGPWLPRELAALDLPDWSVQGPLPLPEPYDVLVEEDRSPGPTSQRWLGAGPQTVTVPASGRLDLRWRVPAAQVGQTLQVQITQEERRQETRQITATTGTVRVSGLRPGPARVTLSGVSGRFLADVPGDQLTRQVVRLGPGGTLSLPLPAGPGAFTVLSYATVADAGTLAWRVTPAPSPAAGLYSALTTPGGARALTARPDRPPAVPWSWEGAALHPLTPLGVLTGEDLPSGARLELDGAGLHDPIWVRVLSSRAPLGAEAAGQTRVVEIP